MPPNQTLPINEQLAGLSGMSPDAMAEFFKQDLSAISADKIIGHLKMAMMFLDLGERDNLKQSILKNLPSRKQNPRLIDFLKLSSQEEMAADIPMENLDLLESKSSDTGKSAADSPKAVKNYALETKLDRVWEILPAQIRQRFNDDPILGSRLRSVIITHLKGIRDRLETEQRLVAKINLGGLEFSHALADDIFKILAEPSKVSAPAAETPAKSFPLKFVDEPHAVIRINAEDNLKTSSLNIERLHKLVDDPQNADVKIPQPPLRTASAGGLKHAANDQANLSKSTLRPAPATRNGDKFTDIQHPENQSAPDLKEPEESPLVSPVDIFKNLTVSDLRHAANPLAFADKLIEQINVLGQEDYNRKLEAVKAWRKSDLHKLYVEIGRDSLGQGMKVSDYLASRQNQDLLSQAEFDAVGELNLRLRY